MIEGRGMGNVAGGLQGGNWTLTNKVKVQAVNSATFYNVLVLNEKETKICLLICILHVLYKDCN